jgi:hypothetical protein
MTLKIGDDVAYLPLAFVALEVNVGDLDKAAGMITY